jgi:hypothetical protein
MRAVNGLVPLVLLLLLAACSRVQPDMVQTLESPIGTNSVVVSTFQPRGTIEGYIVLVFQGSVADKHRTAWITGLENAKIGWTGDGQFAVVADQLAYNGFSSSYFPTGLVDGKVDAHICVRRVVDCSRLEAQMSKRAIEISKFPSP